MAVYTVYQTPVAEDDANQAEKVIFVRDGFSPAVAAFGAFALALTGRWTGLAIYAVLAALLLFGASYSGLHPQWQGLGLMALNFILAFEEPYLRGVVLELSGWKDIGVVEGRNLDDCEERFFARWLTKRSTPQALPAGVRAASAGAPAALASAAAFAGCTALAPDRRSPSTPDL